MLSVTFSSHSSDEHTVTHITVMLNLRVPTQNLQDAQTELEAVLLYPILPATALFLSRGKITGFSQRGQFLVSQTFLG